MPSRLTITVPYFSYTRCARSRSASATCARRVGHGVQGIRHGQSTLCRRRTRCAALLHCGAATAPQRRSQRRRRRRCAAPHLRVVQAERGLERDEVAQRLLVPLPLAQQEPQVLAEHLDVGEAWKMGAPGAGGQQQQQVAQRAGGRHAGQEPAPSAGQPGPRTRQAPPSAPVCILSTAKAPPLSPARLPGRYLEIASTTACGG